MSNFTLRLASLLDGDPVSADDLRYIAECIAKAANFTDGSQHDLGSGKVEIIGGDFEFSASGNILLTGSTKYLQLSERNCARQLRAPWVPEDFGVSTNWGYNYDDDGCWYCKTTDELRIACEETIELAGTLNGIYLRLINGAHSSNWPPEYPTKVQVYKKDCSARTMTLLKEVSDSTGQSFYEDEHTITIETNASDETLAETFTSDERLYIRVCTEHGTNAVTGTEVIGGSIRMAFSELRPV
jgi:hypothetical protein